MACNALPSTSVVSLFYAVDADPDAAIPATITFNEVPFTGESLVGKLTTTDSNRITATRSYAQNVVTSGEVSGSISYEAEACQFIDDMLKAVLQSDQAFAADADAIENGLVPGCFIFLKRVMRGVGYDYYVYRGNQVSTMSMDISPGGLIEGSIDVQGLRVGAGIAGATDGSNDVLTTIPVGWTLTNYLTTSLLSSVYGLQNFVMQDSTPADLGVISNSVSFSFDNQMRQQQGVGTGSPWAVGVASGRFKAELSASMFYTGPEVYNAMLADEQLTAAFSILDATGKGWSFAFNKVKASDAPPPSADSPDTDLIIASTFMAYQAAAGGTVTITKVVP